MRCCSSYTKRAECAARRKHLRPAIRRRKTDEPEQNSRLRRHGQASGRPGPGAAGPGQGGGGRLLRAARMYAFMKGMGFSGVHIGGHGVKYEQVLFVVEKGEELSTNWQDLVREFDYPQPGGFYLYERDRTAGLNRETPVRLERNARMFPGRFCLSSVPDFPSTDVRAGPESIRFHALVFPGHGRHHRGKNLS